MMAILLNKELQTITEVFIFNLSVSDFLIASVGNLFVIIGK